MRQIKVGRAASVVAATLGMPKAGLTNWVRVDARGQVGAVPEGKAVASAVAPDQAEIARLRAQVARLTIECDIAKKAAAYFAHDLLQGTPGFNLVFKRDAGQALKKIVSQGVLLLEVAHFGIYSIDPGREMLCSYSK